MMNRRELVKAIAAHTGVDAKEVDVVVNGLVDVVTAMVARGEMVSISGFARFFRRELSSAGGSQPGDRRAHPHRSGRQGAHHPHEAPQGRRERPLNGSQARQGRAAATASRRKAGANDKRAHAKQTTKRRAKRVAAR